MKICFINSFYYPNVIGGAEISVQKLAEELANRGEEVHIICTGERNKIEIINKVTVHTIIISNVYQPIHLRGGKLLKKNYLKLYYLLDYYNIFNARVLFAKLKEINPDIIHTNNLYGFTTVTWRIAKLLKMPLVHTIRDYSLLYEKKSKLNLLRRRCCKKISNNINVVTAPSHYTLDYFLKYEYFKKAKQKVVYNAIDMNEDLEKILNKRRYKLKDKTQINYVYLGRLEEVKGIKVLLESFHQITNDNINLFIAGIGPLLDLVIDYEKKDKRIKYVGFLNEEDIEKLLLKSDVLIIPSIWPEPFGRVIIEAYKFCMPVIATKVGGIPEIVNENTGVLIKESSLEELKNAIIYFADKKNIEGKLDYCKNYIYDFSIEKQVNQFIKIYKDTIYDYNKKNT